MSSAAETVRRIWTEEELQALPDDGFDCELVDGELVMSPKNNFQHENLCVRLVFALSSFNRAHRLGAVLGSNLGCWMQNHNCRAPDVSFVTKRRLQELGFKPSTRRFLPAAPDLAIEIVSPSNKASEIDARLQDFFSSGTRLAWVVYPVEQLVEVCHSPTDRTVVGMGAALEGEQILPGFRLLISDLFQEWDWD